MKEGYWIRLDNGKSVPVTEHELDIRNRAVARRLGVPDEVFKQFGRFTPGKDRVRFLTWLLSQVGIARVRGRGVSASVAYSCEDNQKAFKAIHRWGRKAGCGPCLLLCMSNLMTGERINAFWLQFDEAMRAGKPVGTAVVTTADATE